ncbi:nucleotidyltransferase domain-containing protein [Candidatus Woesearchaeota archaeon]|nr:nucleotidyltransferase domain-containing protein [Candidatus Woesearchaeota archaeon]
MLQNYSRYRILQEFFDFPRKNFQMRELSRRVKLAQVSVINHLNALLKEGLIIKEDAGIYPSFRANRENDAFKLLKKQNLTLRIYESKLIEYLDDKIKPNCIVLFGSCARGDDTEGSDIDLFIHADEAKLELEKYEKILKRKINLLFEPNIKTISKELLNNLANGQILYGYFKIF